MRPNRLVLALALMLPALSACGGAQALDPATSESLQQQVRELATLTQEGNLDGALSQADALKAEVQAAEDSGAVAQGRALRIQDSIDAFVASIQTETPAPAPAPATMPPAEPAPVPTFTAPAKGGKEDSRDPGETQSDRERKAAEEAAEEARKQAEKEEKERQKQQEDREDD
ncbi:hypothetical protein [Arthrobacter sp. 35/47]|uniref:hypothetical protein n=1 Tax=Arthrobacter sp. 35/47 TaxID=269454 RepID=UPI00047B9F10|nr:hypothetical protein [Arthrobacter sp. 35/47]